jgi:hypothetical protein
MHFKINGGISRSACWFLFLQRISNVCTDPDPSINKQKNSDKPWLLLICDFSMTFYLSLKTDVNVPTVRNKQNNLEKKLIFWHLESNCLKRWIRICNPVYVSKDPAPYQNVTDPEHYLQHSIKNQSINWKCYRILWNQLKITGGISTSTDRY